MPAAYPVEQGRGLSGVCGTIPGGLWGRREEPDNEAVQGNDLANLILKTIRETTQP